MTEEEKYLCEYCGYYTQSKERCTSCGRDIKDLFLVPPSEVGFRIPEWGRMTIRLLTPAAAAATWHEIAQAWQSWEENTNLGMLPSQIEKFSSQADTLELYGSELEVSAIKQILAGRGTIEFEGLPRESIPRKPPPPRPAHWRKPYVPRRRR